MYLLMLFRRSTVFKYFGLFLVGAVVYCEWFIYITQRLKWSDIECSSADKTCTKIMFIADPQIQGNLGAPFPLNHVFIWDSDRYVKLTFSSALNYFKPNILIYLGDLMDEGSIASRQEFHAYAKRLFSIFEVDYPIVQVWLPGDNDIGGENEPIRKDKVIEFSKIFEQSDVITYKNISIYKVNKIIHSLPQIPRELETDGNFKIVASHYPITGRNGFMEKVNNQIHPDIYFCAHDHGSKYVTQNKDFSNRNVRQLYGKDVIEINFDQNDIHEIFVPTCSYRMGTSKIGFGAAILENNNQNMKYTVLWSPTRFPTLCFYLSVIIVLCLYCLIFCIAKPMFRNKIQNRNGNPNDIKPLLEKL